MSDAKTACSVLLAGAVIVPLVLHSLGLSWLGPYAFTLCIVGAVAFALDQSFRQRLDEK